MRKSRMQGIHFKMFSLLFLFFLFSILPISIYAQPPFEQEVRTTGISQLEIVTPLNYYYPLNNNITFNFDILNSSKAKLTNYTANCTFYLANNKGQLELKKNLTYDNSSRAWYQTYYTDDFGVHSYYIHCVSSQNEYGFAIQSFETTGDGVENPVKNINNKAIQISLLLIALTLSIVLFILTLKYKDNTMGTASGFLATIVGIYLLIYGYPTLSMNDFLGKSVAIIILGFGLYVLSNSIMGLLNES